MVQRPELLQQGFLADFIVSKRMFAFFLPDMCKPGAQQLMFRSMTEQTYSMGKQLKVMGYFPTAEVGCLSSTIGSEWKVLM